MLKTLNHRLFWLLLLALTGCRGSEQVSQINLSQAYDLEAGRPEAGFRIFLASDSVAQAFLQLPPPPFSTEWIVKYSVFNNYSSSSAIDTGSFQNLHKNDAEWILTAEIRYTTGSDHLIRVDVTQGSRGRTFTYLMALPAAGAESPQTMLPLKQDGSIFFNKYFGSGESIKFMVSEIRHVEKLKVLYFKEQRALAPPPFSVNSNIPINYKPDSVFYLSVENGISELMTARRQGIYQVLADSLSKSGLAFIKPTGGYPFISSPEQMIHTARYLMSNKEFKACIEAADKKAAIDGFWIEMSGNTNRARTLMTEYYQRVEEANRLFISDTEGWKTDRGMLYIVFGPPDMVYQDEKSELWLYGEAGYSRSLVFRFNRIENPFTNQELRLERVPTFKDPWYMAVNQWRR